MMFVDFQSTVCLFYFSQHQDEIAKKVFNIEGICLRILVCNSLNRHREVKQKLDQQKPIEST